MVPKKKGHQRVSDKDQGSLEVVVCEAREIGSPGDER